MTTLKISNKEACSGSFYMKLSKIFKLSKAGKLEAVDENGKKFIMQKGTFNPVQVQNNDDVIDIEVPLNDDKVVAPTYQFKSNMDLFQQHILHCSVILWGYGICINKRENTVVNLLTIVS